MNLGTVLKALYTGEGIGRVLMNKEIAETVVLSGAVLDVGGRGRPSYRKSLETQGFRHFVVLDVMPDSTVDAAGSITSLPLASSSLDVVLCFNVLEHVFDYTSALSEVRRVLKPGGVLYGRVPFLLGVHADPQDYWRYTRETLLSLLAQAGFRETTVRAQGGLFLVTLNVLTPVLRFGPARVAGAVVAVGCNALLSRVIGAGINRERYPLGYFFVARV